MMYKDHDYGWVAKVEEWKWFMEEAAAYLSGRKWALEPGPVYWSTAIELAHGKVVRPLVRETRIDRGRWLGTPNINPGPK